MKFPLAVLVAASALVALAGTAFGDRFVVRRDFGVDAAWLPKTHMGWRLVMVGK